MAGKANLALSRVGLEQCEPIILNLCQISVNLCQIYAIQLSAIRQPLLLYAVLGAKKERPFFCNSSLIPLKFHRCVANTPH